ncbi:MULTISPECIES: TonB-dependent receptor [unclassified Pseudomonas]|uniref:TonB-dependent receptor n=1 Tax=unclassified Pseudomonas TaxID=196821 RepID=UPI0008773461|nr:MULTISPECIES: TonB-dependent receptor [unclassified Pseudomonas]SCZ20026.1 iron complex outermembrane recepter protein [Pseudomonas sp. NFACC44-2]SDA45139.1 iron complex outermembrane recepter protein [Pseudomonas sp. NFACC51]SFH06627.1 iron complex outermembrane recepter protein [Pseudomonas sp. NFACC54]SFS40938.1 iron complex outermembrane recepter protein [Pseudomonas sp. NFACC48-1]
MLVARPLRPDRPSKPVMRSVLLGLALSTVTGSFAFATVPAQLEAVAPRAYEIAPGPLGPALSSFAITAGIALSFQPSITEGLVSPGLSGTYPAAQALTQLLADSGVEMVARDDGSYTLVLRRVSLPQISVDATGRSSTDLPPTDANGQVARGARLGLLGNTDVMEAPFSISSYTSTMIRDQQATTVGDLLERDASVRSTGQAGGIVDSFFIRGFPLGEGNLGELAFDGVYGVASNYRVFTDYAERIELVKGPAALLYGMSPNSAVGGVINVVPKRALDEDLTRFTSRYATDSQLGGHLDVSRRFGEERRFGIRLNGSLQQGDTAIDKQSRDVGTGAMSLDYQGDRLRMTLDLISQDEKFDAASRPFLIDPGVQIPSAANGRTSVSQDWGRSRARDKSALLSGAYDLSDHLTLFAHAGGGKSEVERMSDQTPTIINAAGDTSSVPGYYKFNVQRYTVDAGARLGFDTGPVNHRAVLQVSRYRDELSRGIISGPTILSNIYHPVDRPRPNIAEPHTPKISESELSGVALADTLSVLNERLQVTLGLRRQNIQSDNYNTIVATPSYDKSKTTPLLGIVAKPWDHVALYYNYIEGLSKGDIAPAAATNAEEIFSPYISRQQEIGVKLDYDRFMATLALFQIKKPSGELSSRVFSVQAQQRNRGVELNLSGEIARGTRLLGGVTLLDGELTRTSVAANRGNTPVGVPKVQANLWAEWDTPGIAGLTLTSGAIYTASQYVDQANTQELDAWTRFDVGARYATRIAERPTTFRATVQNVFDRAYWSGVASYGAFSQGAPRTLLLSATVDF